MIEEPKPAAEEPKPKRRKQSHDMNDDGFDYVVMGTNLSENILAA